MNNFFFLPESTQIAYSALFGYMAIVAGVLWLLQVIPYWRLFKKADSHGWQSIIPIYNEYKFFKITWSGGAFWFMLLLALLNGIFTYLLQQNVVTGVAAVIFAILEILVAIIVLIFNIVSCSKISHAYGKGGGFAVGLFFLRPIFILILGLGSSRYVGKD